MSGHPAATRGSVRHLYVHVPFCRTRCAYCDFSSEALAPHLRAGTVGAYVTAVLQEVERAGRAFARPVDTVYVGGGTPTVLPRAELLRLLAGLGPYMGPTTEVTVEADPETVDAELLEGLAARGVNRLSLGVQSFSADLLAALGRRAEPGAAASAAAALRRAGWAEWNLDLVFGIPGQDRASLAADLAAAVEAGPSHVSIYDLTYTRSYLRFLERRGGGEARHRAAEFAESEYAGVSETLTAAGYARYEVSNYARPGHESRHNLAYWRGEDYIGVGAAAVSTVGGLRWVNPAKAASYLARAAPEEERLTPALRAWERVMLGLRTAEGVTVEEAQGVVDDGAVERLAHLGLVEKGCATLRLSPRGLDVCTAVLAAVLRSPDESDPAPGPSRPSAPEA